MMKRIALAAALALCVASLAGCGGAGSGVASAGDYSAGAAEVAYQAAYRAWAIKVANRTMTPARFRELEGLAYAALLSARNAKTVADAIAAKNTLDLLPKQ